MKKFTKFFLSIFMIASCSLSLKAQDFIPVQGKVYTGNIDGMITLTMEFKSNGNAIVTMSVLGEKDSSRATYDQTGTKIVVHAENGNMIFNQSRDNVLSTNFNGISINLKCLTPTTEADRITEVAGHIYSGNIGNDGRLTLKFKYDGIVRVNLIADDEEQMEFWKYTQDHNNIVMTEPTTGTKFTLTLNKDDITGIFWGINATLSLVQ